MREIRTVVVPLETTIKGYVIKKDDYYTIILNSNLSYEQNKKTYEHELWHIENGDCESKLPVGMLEIIAHKIGGM